MELEEIKAGEHMVFLGPQALARAQEWIGELQGEKPQFFILGDNNTIEHCLTELIEQVPALASAEVIQVAPGERSKDIRVCEELWTYLASKMADRRSVLVNLGGGVISDLGGFVAGTFKRGLRCIHVPTSLMAMVDASIGGKTGVDLAGVKNIVGLFHQPVGVYVHVPFLRTLSKREMLNGLAEMLKHGLVKDEDHWKNLMNAPMHDLKRMAPMIARSAALKAQVIIEDPHDRGMRKILNFGHTIGHAIEAHSWESPDRTLLHGEAIAIGMICESWLSHRLCGLSSDEQQQIERHLLSTFPSWTIGPQQHHRLIELMRNDKKSRDGKIKMTLLEAIGTPIVDVSVNAAQVKQALDHYKESLAQLDQHKGQEA